MALYVDIFTILNLAIITLNHHCNEWAPFRYRQFAYPPAAYQKSEVTKVPHQIYFGQFDWKAYGGYLG